MPETAGPYIDPAISSDPAFRPTSSVTLAVWPAVSTTTGSARPFDAALAVAADQPWTTTRTCREAAR